MSVASQSDMTSTASTAVHVARILEKYSEVKQVRLDPDRHTVNIGFYRLPSQSTLAEIESAVQTALYAAFARKQELSNEDLLTALSSTVPLSITRAEEIAELRAWAKERAVWASVPEARREGA